jgi:hypothetical protein
VWSILSNIAHKEKFNSRSRASLRLLGVGFVLSRNEMVVLQLKIYTHKWFSGRISDLFAKRCYPSRREKPTDI